MCFNFYDSISVSLISLSFVSNILWISTQNVVSSIVYFTVLWFQFVFIVSKSLLRVSISFFSFFHIFLTCLKYQFKNPYLLVSHSESSVSLFLLTQFSFDSGLHFSSNYYILETPGSVTFLGRVLCFILVVKLLTDHFELTGPLLYDFSGMICFCYTFNPKINALIPGYIISF